MGSKKVQYIIFLDEQIICSLMEDGSYRCEQIENKKDNLYAIEGLLQFCRSQLGIETEELLRICLISSHDQLFLESPWVFRELDANLWDITQIKDVVSHSIEHFSENLFINFLKEDKEDIEEISAELLGMQAIECKSLYLYFVSTKRKKEEKKIEEKVEVEEKTEEKIKPVTQKKSKLMAFLSQELKKSKRNGERD